MTRMYDVMKLLVYWTGVVWSLFLISMGSILLLSFFVDLTSGFIRWEDPMEAILWIAISVGMIIYGIWIMKKDVLGKGKDEEKDG